MLVQGSTPWLIGMVALAVAVLVKFVSTVFDEEVSMKRNHAMSRSTVAAVLDVTGAIVTDVAAWACQLA